MLRWLPHVMLIWWLVSPFRVGAQVATQPSVPDREVSMERVVKTDAEWQRLLTPEQYRITRGKGTERPFCGAFFDHHQPGIYVCVCCGLPLFSATAKFDSGTGWPSFFQPVNPHHVATHTDRRLGMERTEILCARCDAHLGHVFEDGPPPTGLRYCLNSESLTFVPEGDLPPPPQATPASGTPGR